MRKIIVILFLVLNVIGNCQNVGIGVCSSLPLTNVQALPYGPYLNYSFRKHQVELGADIYTIFGFKNSLLGTHANYKYLLLNSGRKFNLFTDFNLQYLGYGTGAQWAVPYNYTEFDETKDRNLIRYRSFSNTIGIGMSVKFLRVLNFNLVIGGGYNVCHGSYSPSNHEKAGNPQSIGTFVKPTVYTRLALSFRIWRKRGCTLPAYKMLDPDPL